MAFVAPRYNDFWFKIIGSLVSAHLIDAINREDSFFERFTTPHYYTDLLGGFVISLMIWEVVRFVTHFLDRRYDWLKQTFTRVVWQLLLALLVPALLSFFFTWAFMHFAYDQDIFQTSWLFNEFYSVILIIVLVNVVYFAWWLYLTGKEDKESAAPALFMEESKTIYTPNATDPGLATLTVTKGNKSILLSQNEIAFIYLADSYSYIKTSKEETYLTSFTLDELGRMVDERNFFRANRQVIVNRASVKGYESVENGKIQLDVSPAFKTQVIVSQKRAKDFRKWICMSFNS